MVLCESLCNGSDLYTGSAVPFTTTLCYKLAHCQLAVVYILATCIAVHAIAMVFYTCLRLNLSCLLCNKSVTIKPYHIKSCNTEALPKYPIIKRAMTGSCAG